ncbi:metal ABC transporter substrate-binding protein [Cellulomonas cellasea]|uniref:ABC transporter substrate-binding protein n=2 Tax=Cellulomonas cellasea TaxID=43670 RepID=A0A0A0B6C2_9CELL|nr:metal ABC transporter substrate-binding protein [Cellulomonas cellasea]KGM01732.1 ABC transporter substrate-binding protein [Cellulomonas cellasea DSM 20118]GEA89255.1 ABC transporter substrate-binding protein [Cellulomonas cellasea]
MDLPRTPARPDHGRAVRRARTGLALTAAAALVLGGCASTPADDGRLSVLASFYPLQVVAAGVGGDRVSVDSLTPPGAEPHDLELSPAQVARLGAADLVVYLGEFQAAVDDAVQASPPERALDAADVVELLDAAAEEGAHEGEAHADETHEGETAEEHAEHGEHDPHFWLDPSRMPALVEAVADELSDLDPEGADEYAANAAALSERFTELDAAYETGLATCSSRVLVTSHAAFGYLADRYDLEQVAVAGIDPEGEPSPARLAEIGEVIRSEGVTTVFFETLVSPKVAEALAADVGATTAVLDPLEGLADDSQDYFSIAESNLEALKVALSCS